MHLKDLIIEGFKSYAQKTVIKDFDTHFNAITGLNGSGKSNILDSIIFLLGISGYRDLRASDTRDLIYKQGSAGITMASVTGVFDNSDVNRSPNGYSDCPTITVTRQILQTGMNKYFINNKKVTQNDVQEMFQSVQLNVLNPHFIIMQGRIVKVCNMKPPELLKLVEEATGTTMYDSKREHALKLIEKKQQMLENTGVLLDELKKRKESLLEDVNKYNEYQSLDSKLSKSKRILTACTYVNQKRQLELVEDNADRLQDKIQELTEATQTYIDEKARCQEQLVEAQRELDNASKVSPERDALDIKKKELLTMQSEYEQCEKEIKVSEKKVHEGTKKLNGLDGEYNAAQNQVEEYKKQYKLVKQQQAACQEDISILHNNLLGTDVNDDDDDKKKNPGANPSGGYQSRKMHCERELADLETQQYNLEQRIKDNNETTASVKRQQAGDEQQYNKLKQEVSDMERGVEPRKEFLNAQMKAICTEIFNNNNYQDLSLRNGFNLLQERCLPYLRSRAQELENEIRKTHVSNQNPFAGRQDLWHVQNNLQLLNRITIPQNIQDSIAGLLVNLLTVTEPDQFGLAIEVAAGPRLFNIVVNTYQNGTVLLGANRGGNNALSLLALDRAERNLQPFIFNNINRVKQQFGNNGVWLAADLVSVRSNSHVLPNDFDQVLRYIFGSTFICRDNDTAKNIVKMGCRAVTLRGDSYDPQGLITGGSTNGMGWLPELIKSQGSSGNIGAIQAQLNENNERLQRVQACLQEFHDTTNMLNELNQKQQRLQRTSYIAGQQRLDALQKETDQYNEQLQVILEKINQLKEQIKDYGHKIQQFSLSEGKNMDEAQMKRKIKAEIEAKKKEVQRITQNLLTVQQSLGDYEDQLKTLIDHRADITKSIEEHQQIIAENQAARQALQTSIADKNIEIDEKLQALQRSSREIEIKKKKVDQCTNEIKKVETQLMITKDSVEKHRKELADMKTHIKQLFDSVKQLMKSNPWIKIEEARFTTPGDPQFVGDKTPDELAYELQQDERKHTALKRFNNPMCVEAYDNVNTEYTDKNQKYQRLITDRLSIAKSIEILDKKKIETVENTFQVVNKYFSSIFSILLPGSNSRLRPHRDGNNILVGCEMEVAFSGHWKDSLSELSGGQRSLLALSLILALLRCKPAPLYILDEIDAALDASHTQNIGKTIREHFQQSQFIIVSLKEGMFENANMLIRTQLGPNGSALNVNRRK